MSYLPVGKINAFYDQKAPVIALGDHQLAGQSALIYSSFEKLIWRKVTYVFFMISETLQLSALLADLAAGSRLDFLDGIKTCLS